MKPWQLWTILISIVVLSVSNCILIPVLFITNTANNIVYTMEDSEYNDGRDDLAAQEDWVAPSVTITPIQTEETIIAEEKAYAFNITDEERVMVATLVYLEAGDQNTECQMAVCSVIFNRWSMQWGGAKTLHDVVYARKQFSPAYRIPYTTPTQEQIDVVDYICENGVTDSEIVFFYYKRYSKWGVPCYNIGTEYFSKAR